MVYYYKDKEKSAGLSVIVVRGSALYFFSPISRSRSSRYSPAVMGS